MKTSTDRLRDGDVIHIDGASVKIEGKPDIAIGPLGRTVFRWPNMPIIGGQLRSFPQTLVWTIQGDTLTYWSVTRAPHKGTVTR